MVGKYQAVAAWQIPTISQPKLRKRVESPMGPTDTLQQPASKPAANRPLGKTKPIGNGHLVRGGDTVHECKDVINCHIPHMQIRLNGR